VICGPRRLVTCAVLAAIASAWTLEAGAQRISRANDKTAPVVRVVSPAPGQRVEKVPDIEIAYDDEASGVAAVTFRARVNDRDFSRVFEHHSQGASAKFSRDYRLPLGENRLVVEVADRAGNVGRADVTFVNASGGWLVVNTEPGAGPEARAELILDASGSMAEKLLDNTRMATAKSAIKNLVKGLPPDMALGLRVFTDCGAITALAPIRTIDKAAFVALVDGIKPTGGTPIVASLLQSFEALRGIPDVERVSVIVTDGGESCSGAFAEVVQAAKELSIRVIVIAFDIDNAGITSALQQLADATGGAFIDAQDGSQLQRALEASLQRIGYAVHDPSGQPIHHGQVGGERLELPLGTYEVRFGFSSLRVSVPVTLAPLAESTVTLRGKGRAVRAIVSTTSSKH
jgi:hypothetical protein